MEANGVTREQRKAAISERRKQIPQHPEKAIRQDYLDRTTRPDENRGNGYVPLLTAHIPNRLLMLDAAFDHCRQWMAPENLLPAHQLLLCELARWCAAGNLATVAVKVLSKNLHISRQWISELLSDLRNAGCIKFDPKFKAARNRLRPITLHVTESHSEHVNRGLHVCKNDRVNGGLHVSN